MMDMYEAYFAPACFKKTKNDVFQMVLDRLNAGNTILLDDGEHDLPILLREYMQEETLGVFDDILMQDFIDDWYMYLDDAKEMEHPDMGVVGQQQERRLFKLMQDLFEEVDKRYPRP